MPSHNRRTFAGVAAGVLLDAFAVGVGLVVVVIVALDVFQSVIVPRPSPVLRPSAHLVRNLWRLCVAGGLRIGNAERRESFYGTFAPAVLIGLFTVWIVALILAFGAIFYGLRAQLHPEPTTYWGATYYAGTSLFTLGYGDISAMTGTARALSLATAALGLGTLAVVTAFLFSLFAAFQRRESFIVTLRERIGAPPSGAEYLLRLVRLRMLDDLPETFRLAEGWMADVMETHLAYPILTYFRSTHDEQSWIATIGALLDATTLLLTTVEMDHTGRATMLSRLGRHLVSDFSHYYHFDTASDPGIERSEFLSVYERLREADLRMRDVETAWAEFAELRATYATPLNGMAQYWRIPPARWIGDRSVLSTHHAPVHPARANA